MGRSSKARRLEIPTPAADALARLEIVDLDMVRCVMLCERALAGDVAAAVEWLALHGPEWRQVVDAVRAAVVAYQDKGSGAEEEWP